MLMLFCFENVLADGGAQISAAADNKTGIVTISGTSDKNSIAGIYVLNPGIESLDKMTPENAGEFINYAKQVYTNSDGSFSFSYKLLKNGEYKVYLSNASGTKKAYASFIYVSQEAIDGYIAEIENKMESMSEKEKKAFLKDVDSASSDRKRKLIIIVILALICAAAIFAFQADNGDAIPQDDTGNDNTFQTTADEEEYVAPSINSGEAAKQYLESHLFPDGNLYPEDNMIDGIAFVGETDLGYELHVYKDMGNYVTTIAWLVVTPDGRLYDEIGEDWIWEL